VVRHRSLGRRLVDAPEPAGGREQDELHVREPVGMSAARIAACQRSDACQNANPGLSRALVQRSKGSVIR
jgi:hypothetical protein